jgi:hypothetical protein
MPLPDQPAPRSTREIRTAPDRQRNTAMTRPGFFTPGRLFLPPWVLCRCRSARRSARWCGAGCIPMASATGRPVRPGSLHRFLGSCRARAVNAVSRRISIACTGDVPPPDTQHRILIPQRLGFAGNEAAGFFSLRRQGRITPGWVCPGSSNPWFDAGRESAEKSGRGTTSARSSRVLDNAPAIAARRE